MIKFQEECLQSQNGIKIMKSKGKCFITDFHERNPTEKGRSVI